MSPLLGAATSPLISLASLKAGRKKCRGTKPDGSQCNTTTALLSNGYCNSHQRQAPTSKESSEPTAVDSQLIQRDLGITAKPTADQGEDVEMSTPSPCKSPAESFGLGAMKAMFEEVLSTRLDDFARSKFEPFEALILAQMHEAKAAAAAAERRAAAAEARAAAAEAQLAELKETSRLAWDELKGRMAAVEGTINNQTATIIEKSVAELKASPSWANVVRGGPSAGSLAQQQRSNLPPVEQQFFMAGLEGVEGKDQVELASMVKETLGAIGVEVSDLHDVVLLKPRPGAAAGAPRRLKFTVVTAMQARLIRANRKQLKEVAAHISIRDVLSPEEQAAQNALWPRFVEARKAGKRAYFQRGQLFIDGNAVEASASA